ncbi:MAG: hypothetical protein KTR21_16955 [Rhodobacteraceae bacterium]|nr:hypothetical protein [Paracoccaceae bacterium]
MKWGLLVRAKLIALLGMSSAAGLARADEDTDAWGAAQSSNTREAYESYLSAHPFGKHAPEAFRSIVELDVATSDDVATADVAKGVPGVDAY